MSDVVDSGGLQVATGMDGGLPINTRQDTLLKVASMLSPPVVSQYLANHDWQLEYRDQDVKEIWRLPGEDGLLGRIMLPLATDYVDFPRRFRETLQALATIYDCDLTQLVERIAIAWPTCCSCASTRKPEN
ncbi:hypothetical protein [Nocardia gamkensis]|uniref:Uncharacterized protein n=1 Tax=Nocardia gamkensis TaxID=352869 RepID=A0A7X6L4Y8_9NOCA|nr:hypothetical protein [Nocardia gamkensis]NKY27921.1 hypothetical protein [Nocardia gamkensis]NQE67568.1 hypothetical protein [Nocardia gamkensis]